MVARRSSRRTTTLILIVMAVTRSGLPLPLTISSRRLSLTWRTAW